jgi:hypothetical protein
MMEKAVTLFPQPDSPAIATVSPLLIVKERESTALMTRSGRLKTTERFFTESRGGLADKSGDADVMNAIYNINSFIRQMQRVDQAAAISEP